jgi:hypothetical protein
MLKKILLIIFISLLVCWNITFSDDENIDTNITKVYNDLYTKVKRKYKIDNGLWYLYTLKNTLDIISNSDKINSKNYQVISNLQKLNNEKIFEIEYNNITDKYVSMYNDYEDLVNYFKIFSSNDANVFIENWVWYAYIFPESVSFDDPKYFNTANFKRNNLNENTLVIYNQELNKISFVLNYKKVRLVSNSIIYGFPDKYELLTNLKKYKNIDDNWDSNDSDYLNLKSVSTSITNWLYKNDDKIAVIYNYVLENVKYTTDSPDNYSNYYSWIKTFITKEWVCLGYVQLLNLMLGFNNISSEIIEWNVINSENYPEIWHAWIRIGDYYYDPTFDDSIWQGETLPKEKYLFYKLPQDLFYADRFDLKDSPKYLETTSLWYRKQYVNTKLSILYPKYKNLDYNILAPYKFKDKYWIPLKLEITLNDLKKIMQYWELVDNKIIINWQTRDIKKLNYLTLKDDNIEYILKDFNYNIDWLYLLNWQTWHSAQHIIVKINEIEY